MSRRSTQPKPRKRRAQRATGGFKVLADAKKHSVDLLADIQSHVVTQQIQHGNDHRSKDKIHVSEITKSDSCPRRLFYKISGEEESDNETPPTAWLVRIWSAGSAEHEKWQGWIREMGDLWGTWTCLVCEHSWEDTSPTACPKCDSGLLRYDEVNMADPEYPLIGHADAAVPRLNALVEIKSFSVGSVRVENSKLVNKHTHKVDGRTLTDVEGIWKDITKPLRSHLEQGLIYLWMCKRMGLPYDRIIFLYENKTNQATKTFEVRLTERLIKQPLSILAEVEQALYDGVPPERPRAFAQDAKPCKDCPFRTTCWGEGSDNSSTQGSAVSAGRQSQRGEAEGGEAEVHATSAARRRDPGRPRRHHRPERRGPDPDDDRADQVGRAPRRAGRDGRSGRAVGRSSDGEGAGPRFARRHRQGRDED